MALGCSGRVRRFFTIPPFPDGEQNQLARQLNVHLPGMILGYTLAATLLVGILSWTVWLGMAMAAAPLAANLALLAMAKRGRLKAAALLLVIELWLIITLFAFLPGGVGARAAWGFFIIVFNAGMMLGELASIAAMAGCSLTTLVIAFHSRPLSPHPWAFWLINTLYLTVMIYLQHLAGGSIRESLAGMRNELGERLQAEKERELTISLLKATLNSATDGILVVNRERRITQFNRRFAEIWGIPEGVLTIGGDEKTIAFVLDQLADPEGFLARVEEMYASPLAEGFDLIEFRDGRCFERYSRPQMLSGQPVGRVWSFRDVSERRRAGEELARSEEKFRVIFDKNASAIAIIEPDTTISMVNDAYCRMSGYSREEVVGTSWTRHIAPADLERLKAYNRRRIAHPGDAPFQYEFGFRHKSGEIKHGLISVASMPESGKIIASFIDMTDSKRAEESRLEALARFSGFAEASQYGMGMADLEGRILYANPTLVRMLGEKTAEDCLGKHFPTAYYAPAMSRKIQEEVLPALLRDGHWQGELELSTVDGRRVPTDENYFVIRDERGRPLHLADLLTDVSERKQAEEKLLESERRYRTLFESAGDAIFLLRGNQIVDCNSRTLEIFGCSREQILAQPISRFHPPRQPDGSDSLAKGKEKNTAALNGAPQFFEWRHVRYNGEPFDAEVSLTRIQLAGGIFLLALVRDVSERRKLEEQLLQAQKMEAVGILAGGVAHDFNNILSTIVGFGSMLQMRLGAEPQLKDYSEKILDSCERAVRLTSSLLTFSRKQEIDLQPLDVNQAVHSFHKILARLIGEDIEFRVDLASQPLVVDADVRQIEQVLMNLATNSRDAMPGGGRLTIATAAADFTEEVGEVSRGSYAAITVTDTGSGMGTDVQAHIFEPFFTTKEVGKGTGLGLAIVYGIIKKHNGFITVASAPGQGTAFTIHLPLKSKEAKEGRRREIEPIPSGSETILLIEDDAAVRQATRSLLEEFGYAVREAADGEAALELFRRQKRRIGLVLCDLIMPGLNGRQTLAAIQAVRPGIRAIFMSGYTADVIAEKGLAGPGVDLVMKPLSPAVLLRKVREVLDRK